MQNWQPTASIETLKLRATLLRNIREFFYQRQVLEVEAPLLAQYGVTDPYNENFRVDYFNQSYYLQTSPEYHLKRLLCAGVPDLYQLSKAFRYESVGKHHNPEFTMLEWYRLGWDYHQLIDEVIALVTSVCSDLNVHKITYQNAFIELCGIDPFAITSEILAQQFSQQFNIISENDLDKDDCLNLIFTHLIEPQLTKDSLYVIYDYPASQAALAIREGQTARRFECYLNGIELANGFEELTDPIEQEARFKQDNVYRLKAGLEPKGIDEMFINALKYGLPECSGVALGVDRLFLAMSKLTHLKSCISFDFNNA